MRSAVATDAAGSGRIMGVDYGRRRVGVAMSDASGILATPLTTLQRRAGKRPPVTRLLELAARHGVGRAVLGLPLDPDGGESEWTAEVRTFAAQLADRGGFPVELQDERYSSAEAEARIRSAGLPRKKKEDKGRVDAAAAAIILQDWLDGQAGP